jgi:glycosyltransferase involved in cell wall biosynthesis
MKQPLVSIIVTCYNQAHCITNTLESIVSQTYTNWECVIVDDGSFDDSAEVIKEFIKDDTRFTYLFQDNQGVSRARNKGFALATGSFINFMDGDDTFLPDKLEKQLQVFKEHPEVSISICDHQHFLAQKDAYVHYTYETLEPNPLRQIIYSWQQGLAFPLHAVLYNRKLWTEAEQPYPEDYEGRSEDWIFNILVALKNKTYYFLNEVLCTYHHDDTNYTTEIYNSAGSAIHAAFYIHPYLTAEFQTDFLDHTIRKSMNRYLESKKVEILHSSGNWRLGNRISKPLFWLKKKLNF